MPTGTQHNANVNGLEAAFYVDLGSRAIGAVEMMKRNGDWPQVMYSRCEDQINQTYVTRSLDLVSAMKVCHTNLIQF